MRRLIVLLTIMALAGCTAGIRYTYDTATGAVISKEPNISILQLQLKAGAATVYSDTTAGFRIKCPIPGGSAIDVLDATLGYLRSTRGVVPIKPDGELPVVIVDTSVNPFNKDGVTDTFLLGSEAVRELYAEASEEEE